MKVFNLEEQVVLLEKYKINSDELLFITVILLIQEGDDNPYINLYFSLPPSCRGSIRDLLVSLQEKQILEKIFKMIISFDASISENLIEYILKKYTQGGE